MCNTICYSMHSLKEPSKPHCYRQYNILCMFKAQLQCNAIQYPVQVEQLKCNAVNTISGYPVHVQSTVAQFNRFCIERGGAPVPEIEIDRGDNNQIMSRLPSHLFFFDTAHTSYLSDSCPDSRCTCFFCTCLLTYTGCPKKNAT